MRADPSPACGGPVPLCLAWREAPLTRPAGAGFPWAQPGCCPALGAAPFASLGPHRFARRGRAVRAGKSTRSWAPGPRRGLLFLLRQFVAQRAGPPLFGLHAARGGRRTVHAAAAALLGGDCGGGRSRPAWRRRRSARRGLHAPSAFARHTASVKPIGAARKGARGSSDVLLGAWRCPAGASLGPRCFSHGARRPPGVYLDGSARHDGAAMTAHPRNRS